MTRRSLSLALLLLNLSRPAAGECVGSTHQNRASSVLGSSTLNRLGIDTTDYSRKCRDRGSSQWTLALVRV